MLLGIVPYHCYGCRKYNSKLAFGAGRQHSFPPLRPPFCCAPGTERNASAEVSEMWSLTKSARKVEWEAGEDLAGG